jgi:hypothetical protein
MGYTLDFGNHVLEFPYAECAPPESYFSQGYEVYVFFYILFFLLTSELVGPMWIRHTANLVLHSVLNEQNLVHNYLVQLSLILISVLLFFSHQGQQLVSSQLGFMEQLLDMVQEIITSPSAFPSELLMPGMRQQHQIRQ